MGSRQFGLDWQNIAFLTITPLAALVATPLYIYFNGVHWAEIVAFLTFYWVAGLGITMGYHRLFSHKTYEAHPILKFFLLVFGAMAFEHSAYKWSADHRIHHQHTDDTADPYNAKMGFWHSHILWVFYKEEGNRSFDNVNDLAKDRLVMWQHRNYVALAGMGWLLPLLIGFAFGRPFGFFLWAGLIRTVFVHHSTFFVNSIAHICGRQTYDDRVSARDSWWVALLSFGEGYHNFHHRFSSDYRNGVRWFAWDPPKWLIYLGSKLGLTRQLRRSPDELIISKRLDMDFKRTQAQLAKHLPQERWQVICQELEQRRTQVVAHWKEWKAGVQQYAALKREQNTATTAEMKARLKAELANRKELFREAMQRWNESIQFYLANPAMAGV